MNRAILFGACFACILTSCSSSGTSGGGGIDGSSAAGGTGGASGGDGGATGGAAGKDAGPSCTTVTGTYAITGTRDASNPGSCPNNLAYPDGATATLAKNGASYALSFESPLNGNSCSVNVTNCVLSATCGMQGRLGGTLAWDSNWQGEIAWTITETGASGTDHWTSFSSNVQATKCSANWTVTAMRQ